MLLLLLVPNGDIWLMDEWDIGYVEASAYDSVSGVVKYEYSYRGGSWKSDSWGYCGNRWSPHGPGEGIHSVTFRAQNGAGLWSGSSNAYYFKIDLSAPQLSCTLLSGFATNTTRGYSITLNFSPLFVDSLSGQGQDSVVHCGLKSSSRIFV